MSYFSDYMTQQITYWEPGTNDGIGGLDFSSAARSLLIGRWQDDAVLFRDANGQEVTSQAIVYLPASVRLRGYLMIGDQTSQVNPRTLAAAYEIRQVGQSPSIDGDETLVKVYL